MVQRSAIRGCCAHGCACCLQISAPAISDDVIGWQWWRGSSSSSRSDSGFTVYNKVKYSSLDSRVLGSSLCLLPASERLGSAVYLCGCPSCKGKGPAWIAQEASRQQQQGRRLGVRRACNKLTKHSVQRAMCSLSCSRLAGERPGCRSMTEAVAQQQQ